MTLILFSQMDAEIFQVKNVFILEVQENNSTADGFLKGFENISQGIAKQIAAPHEKYTMFIPENQNESFEDAFAKDLKIKMPLDLSDEWRVNKPIAYFQSAFFGKTPLLPEADELRK
jgi:hypothetical protein